MNATTTCPGPRQLEGLLRDDLPAAEQDALMEHVGACSGCQRALDDLAAGPPADRLRPTEVRPASDSAFWPAVEKLEKELAETNPDLSAVSSSAGVDLKFLSPPEEPGQLGMLGQYAIVGIVGRGGMGVVLRGFDTHLEREVAVKVLDPAMADDETAQHRFCREARAAASIAHENVVAVHHVAEEGQSEVPYLVMQLVDGEALDERLARDGRPELKEVVRIGAQVAAGLAAAHEKGLIHRDVKPANIFIEKATGRVKLTDFGLARAAEDVRLTRTGLVAGTPLYMAPEQAKGDDVDARADLFSLGVVLYELSTGETPFEAKTPLAVLRRLAEEPHRPVRELSPDVPPWLVDVIDRLLAKSPADRFQTARQVADVLEHYHAALKTSSAVTPICPIAAKRAARWRFVASVVAAAALGAVLTAGILLWSGRGGVASPESSAAPLAVLRASSGTVWGVAFAPGDKTLAMTIEDGSVKLWDLDSNAVRTTLNGHKGSVWSAAFNRDGSLLATPSDDNTVRVWDVAQNEEKMLLKTDAAARVALFGPDGRTLYAADRGGDVRLFDVESGAPTRGWKHPGAVYALALSADGKTAATAGTDRTVRVWDARKGQERMPLAGHAGPVYGLAFRPDGKVLASAGWDHTIRLWDVGSGELLRAIEGHVRDIWAVDFAPDGKTLASAGQDGTVRVWDAATGKQLAVYRGHDGTVHAVTFSRDGSRIASGSRDGTVRIWPAPAARE